MSHRENYYSFGFPTRYDYAYGYPVQSSFREGTYSPYSPYGMYPAYAQGAAGNIAWMYPYHPIGYGPNTTYRPRYWREAEKHRRKMFTARCYDTTEYDDCRPGYRKFGKDTTGDGEKDEWKCCRRR